MRMPFKTFALALITLTTFTAPAYSQQSAPKQTVENAQKFLEITLPGKSYRPAFMQDALTNGARKMGGGVMELSKEAKIIDASIVGRCKSMLRYEYSPSTELIATYSGRRETRPLSSVVTDAVGPMGDANGISWTDALSIEAIGSSVYIKWDSSTSRASVDLGAESLAKRVAYAMEFLRINCDKAAATGF